MTKEEYLLKKEELKNALQMLDKQYIEANKPCNIGDIIADKYGVKGIVTGFEISSFICLVYPTSFKLKKDGSVSVKKLYIGSGYTVLSKNTNT